MPPLNNFTRSCIAVAITQMAAPVSANGAVAEFFPTTAAELVTAVTTSNSNNASDTIDLGGNTITLTAVDNTPGDSYGANGLPVILPDSDHPVTFTNGAIVRQSDGPAFRILDIAPDSDVTLSEVTISQGSANFGGGILNRGSLQIERSTISTNVATTSGGGVLTRTGFDPMTFELLTTATLSIVNSTITQNGASGVGGGIYNILGSLNMLNATVGDNNADAEGAGLASVVGAASAGGPVTGELTLVNNLFGYNSANASPDVLVRLNFPGTSLAAIPANVARNNYLSEGAGANGIVNGIDGNIVGVGSGEFPTPGGNGGPTYTSPINRNAGSRDAGDNTVCPATDQRGQLRDDGLCDIGATEFASLSTIVTTAQDNVGGIAGQGISGCSLRDAVYAVYNGTNYGGCIISNGIDNDPVVLFDAALANQTIELQGRAISINPDVTIDAGSISGLTIDGMQLSPVLVMPNAGGNSVVIDNITITGGSNAQQGGGIVLDGSGYLTLLNSRVNGNVSASNGGGVYVGGGNLYATNSTFSNNSAAANGGGISAQNSSSVTLTNTTVSNNRAVAIVESDLARGGGIELIGSTLISEYSTINNNSTAFSGGGVFAHESYIDLSRSTVSNNITDNLNGGGITVLDSTLSAQSSTLSGNTASSGAGGAIHVYFLSATETPSVSMVNSTVSGNAALVGSGGGYAGYGGALSGRSNTVIRLSNTTVANNLSQFEARGAVYSSGTVVLRNSIVADTRVGQDCFLLNGYFDTDANSIVEDGSCAVSDVNAQVSARTGDPGLEPLGNNGGRTRTHALRGSSIARNTASVGGESDCENPDQRGKDRFEDGPECDVGAVEFDAGDGAGFIVIPLGDGKAVVIPN